ncbi:hypothetical protein APY04_2064 [Hyphomicrobium sulfonivorans]|uniref:Uncharacterized protein n=1 Tax=Hyphomicrobium sulfonivorans TaxID=121290 RepID=A0A120CV04_HYPSL|nr:hypothetical protein APY04_2064 [Hyphomicrobium sulfonivorans]
MVHWQCTTAVRTIEAPHDVGKLSCGVSFFDGNADVYACGQFPHLLGALEL